MRQHLRLGLDLTDWSCSFTDSVVSVCFQDSPVSCDYYNWKWTTQSKQIITNLVLLMQFGTFLETATLNTCKMYYNSFHLAGFIFTFLCLWNLQIPSPRDQYEAWKIDEILWKGWVWFDKSSTQHRDYGYHMFFWISHKGHNSSHTKPEEYKYMLYFLPFIWCCGTPKVFHACTTKAILLSSLFTLHSSNLAALKKHVSSTTHRLDLSLCFMSASCNPKGRLSVCVLVCTAWPWEISAALFFCLAFFSLLIGRRSAWQFGGMARAPQELTSNKMSPWLCSTCPMYQPDTLYTWELGSKWGENLIWMFVSFATDCGQKAVCMYWFK